MQQWNRQLVWGAAATLSLAVGCGDDEETDTAVDAPAATAPDDANEGDAPADGPADNAPGDNECGDNASDVDGSCECDPGFMTDPDDAGACIAEVSDAGEDTEEPPVEVDPGLQGRILVADGAEGRVVVVDLELGEAIATLDTEGSARVYASSDGSRAFAVQTSMDAVQLIESGVRYEDAEAIKTAPQVMGEAVVSCSRPIHFVVGHGGTAAFCDGDGMLHVFDDTADVDTMEVSAFDSGRAHHGVGVVAFDHVVLSAPNMEDEEDALPIGVRAFDLDGEEQAVFNECPSLHGEAYNGEALCFGCSDGVMCVSQAADGSLVSQKVVPPADAEEGVRVGRIAAGSHGGALIGNWGQDLALVDLEAGELVPVPVGEPYLSFAQAADGEHVVVLTDAGELRRLAVADGSVAAEAEVFDAFMREPGHGQVRPNMLVGSHRIYVVDPRTAALQERDPQTLELLRSIPLEDGQFHSLAIVGQPSAQP